MTRDAHACGWSVLRVRVGAEELVRDVWRRAVLSGGSFGADYAVFQRRHGREEELSLYFTPAARPLASMFGGRRCPRPAQRGLQLLAGSPGAMRLHFPPAAAGECGEYSKGSLGTAGPATFAVQPGVPA